MEKLNKTIRDQELYGELINEAIDRIRVSVEMTAAAEPARPHKTRVYQHDSVFDDELPADVRYQVLDFITGEVYASYEVLSAVYNPASKIVTISIRGVL